MRFLSNTQDSVSPHCNRNLGSKASARKIFQKRLRIERLEERRLLAGVIPDDPGFPQQWELHNTGQSSSAWLGQGPTGGGYDADMDLPAAWSITTGSMKTVVAVLDLGVDYTDPDLYLNIWLNRNEIPAGFAASLTDADSDGLMTFRDLNAAANATFVSDVNANGYIDGGDLLRDPRWANGVDGDGNGKVDDLVGWDFHNNDNDPKPEISGGVYQTHGTDMAKIIGAMTNNGLGSAGINWEVRLIPVRIRSVGGATTDLINTNAAAGIDYAVASGAPISNNSWRAAGGGYVYSQELYDAISRARLAGHLFIAGAGNDGSNNDVSPFYPASYDLDNIISATVDEFTGLPNTNWGPISVDLGAFPGGSSGASAQTSGVAALIKSLHSDWTYAQIKSRILSTVEPTLSLTGKTVTGGRLNAAMAVATSSISISDPTTTETDAGTRQLVFTVTRVGDTTGDVTLGWSTSNGTAISGSDYVAAAGQINFLAAGGNTQTISITVKGDVAHESAETIFINLTIISGNAVLADEIAQGQILDNDTKFYVVNDATTNLTYEYGITGIAIENYSLSSGNTAPRGAASTAAGDKVWVVDANKKVYVYNTSGGLLGSWSLGSLASNATVEGITTNGTDVWIVDSRSDKVFKYAGAATRTTLSQNASSSFSLNSSNTSPTDLVTDGTSIWVLNNTSSTDKVFKYSVVGASIGNWTITSGGGSPTGLTIDPTINNSNIWIVDNNTDRVYQFDSATTRTSGSASPSLSFALAAGNANPQGIADPPPPVSMLASHAPSVATGTSIAEVENPHRKIRTPSDPFIAQVDSFFENWNEDSVSSQTKKRLAGRR